MFHFPGFTSVYLIKPDSRMNEMGFPHSKSPGRACLTAPPKLIAVIPRLKSSFYARHHHTPLNFPTEGEPLINYGFLKIFLPFYLPIICVQKTPSGQKMRIKYRIFY